MMQAMIFAAGLGTRLKPLTDSMPKALVRVGGEPLLKRVIFRLKDAGFNSIIINVHHFASQIIDYLKENDNFGLDIKISDETSGLLETGGGIKKAIPLFNPNDQILIHNVDILSNVDLKKFYHVDRRVMCKSCGVPHRQAGAVLLVSWRKTKRYLMFNDDMLLVGWLNIETGEIKSPYAEVKSSTIDKLRENYKMYAFSGIHSFSPQLFPFMSDYPDKFPIMDFYLQNCDKIAIKGYVKEDLKLMDVGKLDTIDNAETFLEELNQ
ncbi:sugar phosphate nucleotidyltransferase [Prevotella sp.]|uniref:sugar phosphate nucleotidyltransferase n=1 Tax=Prevotella sp. TaxID=59823 RepID=UPI002648DDD1|nr:sugar phosphate nucleotidyltransferase [Prevotella sp.]MDN5553837.1 NTP transferase domain-containing protein [Prevotella sp.]